MQKKVEIATAVCIRFGVADINYWLGVTAETANCGSVILRLILGDWPVAAWMFDRKQDQFMADYDDTAFNHEQGSRARKLFAAVVLAALDDAIVDHRKYGNGPDVIERWARSRDGREVLTCAGIDPNERVVDGLKAFVERGIRTSVALSREESERRTQRARAA